MSANVYKCNNTRSSCTSTIKNRMRHEVLIDTFRALCRQYGVRYLDIAHDICYSPKFVWSVLNKRQYVTNTEYILMCKALEARICRYIQSNIFMQGQTGYNSATYPQRK